MTAESDQSAWLSVRCPACRAHPGWDCVNRDGWFRSKPHLSRVEAVATSPGVES